MYVGFVALKRLIAYWAPASIGAPATALSPESGPCNASVTSIFGLVGVGPTTVEGVLDTDTLVADPFAYPFRVVEIDTVDETCRPSPDTVTRPVLLTETVPDSELVPFQLKAES